MSIKNTTYSARNKKYVCPTLFLSVSYPDCLPLWRFHLSRCLPDDYTKDDDFLTSPALRMLLSQYRLKKSLVLLEKIHAEVAHLKQIYTPFGQFPIILKQWINRGTLVPMVDNRGQVIDNTYAVCGDDTAHVYFDPATHRIYPSTLKKASDGFKRLFDELHAHNEMTHSYRTLNVHSCHVRGGNHRQAPTDDAFIALQEEVCA